MRGRRRSTRRPSHATRSPSGISEILTIQYRTDPEAIRALLPPPLKATGDTVLLHIARYGDVPGVGRDLHECNVMVGATYDGQDGIVEGAYSPYFFLDSDRMITFGREVQGQPRNDWPRSASKFEATSMSGP